MSFLYWFVFHGLVAWFAASRGHNPWQAFLLSVLLSPIIGLIVYLILGERKWYEQPR